jgi:sec-independent protein translocase protein TatC
MPLMEHLRELRRRVFICVLSLVPGTILGWIYYDTLVQFLADPVCSVDVKGLSDGDTCGPLVINGLWDRSTCR